MTDKKFMWTFWPSFVFAMAMTAIRHPLEVPAWLVAAGVLVYGALQGPVGNRDVEPPDSRGP